MILLGFLSEYIFLEYLLNNSGGEGVFASVLRTLANTPPPFFEKILSGQVYNEINKMAIASW